MLHEQEEWLSENRAEISAKIEAGFESAQRGDLLDEKQVNAFMAERRRDWLAQQHGTRE